MDEIFRWFTLFMVVMLLAMTLLVVTDSLWMPVLFRFKQWFKTKNKRLCDYDIHGDPGCLMAPLMDGLIDSDFYWAVDRKTWRYDEIDEHLLVVSKLSKKLERRINERYNTKGMQNAYARGVKTLRNYRRRRAYYAFDEEFDALYAKAMELKKDNCLKCDDRGGTWEPHGASAQSFAPCDCKNARRSFFS